MIGSLVENLFSYGMSLCLGARRWSQSNTDSAARMLKLFVPAPINSDRRELQFELESYAEVRWLSLDGCDVSHAEYVDLQTEA